MRTFAGLFLSICLLLFTGVSHAGQFEEGAGAFYTKDYKAAFELWLPLANDGDVTCQVLIGSMYAFGQGVAKNDEEAVNWFRRAAEQGSDQGQFNLAVMYENGWGVEQDIDTAIFWFTKAARQGREDARRKYRELERQKYLASRPQQPGSVADNQVIEETAKVAGEDAVAVKESATATRMADSESPPLPSQPAGQKPAQQDTRQATVISETAVAPRPAAVSEPLSGAEVTSAVDEQAPLAPVSSLSSDANADIAPRTDDTADNSDRTYSSFPNPFEFIGLLLGDFLGGGSASSDTGFADDSESAADLASEGSWTQADDQAGSNDALQSQGTTGLDKEGITKTPDGRVQMVIPPAAE